MSKQSVKTTINDNIKQNGHQEITGPVLNSVLNEMVDNLAEEASTTEKLTELEGKVEGFSIATTNASGVVKEYRFVAGETYFLKNTGNVKFSAFTRKTADGQNIQTIKEDILAGEVVQFVSNDNYEYIRIGTNSSTPSNPLTCLIYSPNTINERLEQNKNDILTLSYKTGYISGDFERYQEIPVFANEGDIIHVSFNGEVGSGLSLFSYRYFDDSIRISSGNNYTGDVVLTEFLTKIAIANGNITNLNLHIERYDSKKADDELRQSIDNTNTSIRNTNEALENTDKRVSYIEDNLFEKVSFELGSIDSANGQNFENTTGSKLRTGFISVFESKEISGYIEKAQLGFANIFYYNNGVYVGYEDITHYIAIKDFSYNIDFAKEFTHVRIAYATNGATVDNIKNSYACCKYSFGKEFDTLGIVKNGITSTSTFELGSIDAGNGALSPSTDGTRIRTKEFVDVGNSRTIKGYLDIASAGFVRVLLYNNGKFIGYETISTSKGTFTYTIQSQGVFNQVKMVMACNGANDSVCDRSYCSCTMSSTNLLKREQELIDLLDKQEESFFEFTIPDVPKMNSDEDEFNLFIEGVKVAGMYAKWDELVSLYPSAVSLEETHGSSTNIELRLYDIAYPIMGDDNRKLAIIQANEHGPHSDEKSAAFCAFEFARRYLTNESEFYVWLRRNYKLKVIPIVNPYGFNNDETQQFNGRANANGVNINRNYDAEWVAGVDALGVSHGSGPASEPETQFVQSVIDKYNNAYLYVSIHAHNIGQVFGALQADNNSILSQHRTEEVGNFWKSKFPFEELHCTLNYTGGVCSRYAIKKGIMNSYLIECRPKWSLSEGRDGNFGTKPLTGDQYLLSALFAYK